VLVWVTAKYCMKSWSSAHSMAGLFPHFWAIRLNFWARGRPTSLIMRAILLSMTQSSFLRMEVNTLARRRLRTLSTTLMAKPMYARSAPFNALNQMPRRMALDLILASSPLVSGIRARPVISVHTFLIAILTFILLSPRRAGVPERTSMFSV